MAGVIPVRAVGPARRDAQNRYSSDLGGSSSVDGCLLLTREMRQVYVYAGDIRCRCPAFAAGAGCRHRRALAETMRSELAGPLNDRAEPPSVHTVDDKPGAIQLVPAAATVRDIRTVHTVPRLAQTGDAARCSPTR